MSLGKVAFLFDIDGTLLTVHHHGREALTKALGECCGADTSRLYLEMAGRTDLSIIREALALFKIAETQAIFAAISAKYLANLENRLILPEAMTVFPGAYELLAALKNNGALLGLGTGNMQRGAQLKMEKSELASYFTFGGYGDDDEDRGKVLQIACQRALAIAGEAPIGEFWVVGDTPLDIKAGRAIGAKVCAIANGRYTAKELWAFEPDLAFDDLPAAQKALLNLL